MENFCQYKYLCFMDYVEKYVFMGDNFFIKFCRLKLVNLSVVIFEVESMVNEIMFCVFEQFIFEDGFIFQVVDIFGIMFVKFVMSVWKVYKFVFLFNFVVWIFCVL